MDAISSEKGKPHHISNTAKKIIAQTIATAEGKDKTEFERIMESTKPKRNIVYRANFIYKGQQRVYEVDDSKFNYAYIPYLQCNDRYSIFFGGYGSGKSVFINYRIILDVAFGGRNYLCLKEYKTDIETSIYSELSQAVNDLGLNELFVFTKNPFRIRATLSKTSIDFLGLDDPQRVKSYRPLNGVLTDIFVEEATSINNQSTLDLLDSRLRGIDKRVPLDSQKSKRITLAFNPVNKSHFLFGHFFAGKFNNEDRAKRYKMPIDEQKLFDWFLSADPDLTKTELSKLVKSTMKDYNVSILKTTYADNRFLMPVDIMSRENAVGYEYEVGTLGNWGTTGVLLFKAGENWEAADLSNENKYKFKHLPILNGLDFGYTDPTAFVRLHIDRMNKKIYIIKEFGDTEMGLLEIAQQTKKIVGNELVRGDSGGQGNAIVINLKNRKLVGKYALNIKGVKKISKDKSLDYVRYKVKWLKLWKIIIDFSCTGTIMEFENMTWKMDRQGKETGKIFGDHHLLDAATYALNGEMVGGNSVSSYKRKTKNNM